MNKMLKNFVFLILVSLVAFSCVSKKEKIEEIRTELIEILKTDQEPRNRIVELWQTAPNDTLSQRQLGMEIWRNDSINLIRVCEIIDQYGLVFGEENEILWVVIQHGSLEAQQKYLPMFVEAAEQRNIKGELLAMLQDRIACRLGKPQIYGTQGYYNENGIFESVAMIEPEKVNERRASIGMNTLEEYIEQMNNQYTK